MNYLVYTKDLQSATFTADLTSELLGGETLASVVEVSISPSTSPPFAVGTIVVTSPTVTIPVTGGMDQATYGVLLRCTTNLSRVFDVKLAVYVTSETAVPFATRNPNAYQTMIGTMVAGDAGLGTCLFTLPKEIKGNNGYVTWEMLDAAGSVLAFGNAFDYVYEETSFNNIVQAHAVINVPSTVQPTLSGQAYQIRWALLLPGQPQPLYAFESLTVSGGTTVPLGASQSVEMIGDAVQMELVVERAYPKVEFEVYRANTKISDAMQSMNPKRVAGGWCYTALIDTSNTTLFQASLNPYSVLWRYKDTNATTPQRETGRVFLVNASMMNAIEDVQAMVMKARTTIDQQPDTIFDPVTILTWLRRGKDMFNMAGGIITDFNMTNASGVVREAWIRYSEVAALQAQYLAEGEKAFNFSGQNISLDVDRTQYFQTLANDLQNQLDNMIATLKKNLKIAGVTSGDGDVEGSLGGNVAGAMGAIGIGVNAISPNFPFYRAWPVR